MPVLSVNQVPQPASPRQRIAAILLVCAAVFGFTIIDTCAKWLTPRLGPAEATFLRYLAGFLWIVPFLNPWRVPGVLVSEKPWLQLVPGCLLLASTALNFLALQYLQLAQTVSIMFLAPLIVSLAAGPILGEWPGPRRLVAIGIGFVGVLVILQPGFGVFRIGALIPLLAAFMFALYGLLTRFVGRHDSSAVSFFWTGVSGALVTSAVGIWYWEPMIGTDWLLMLMLCFTSALSHYLLIRAYEVAEASAIQPFAYLQLVFASAIGFVVFNETLRPNVAIGAAIVVCAGLFTLWRARVAEKRP